MEGAQSHAAYSRHIDARYYTPHPAVDWLAGTVQETNTENEEAYASPSGSRRFAGLNGSTRSSPRRTLRCLRLAKNKARFARQGVVCVVQDYRYSRSFSTN